MEKEKNLQTNVHVVLYKQSEQKWRVNLKTINMVIIFLIVAQFDMR